VSRVDALYKPYHLRLRALLMEAHGRNGHAILIDCHSMPASVRVGENRAKAGFCGRRPVWNCRGCRVVATGDMASYVNGLCGAHNKPYAGGFITEHYGRPAKGLHAIQIEINRSLYMDERSLKKLPGFDALVEDLMEFASKMMAGAQDLFDTLPLAAE
jgi:N-formylglutamate amidohydrolase